MFVFRLFILSTFVTYAVVAEAAQKKLTIPSKYTHPACLKNDVVHSEVVQNHSLKKGINPQNYTSLGQVPSMDDCMALCCSTKSCNIAYMKNDTCYAVTCYDPVKCSIENGTATPDSGTQLALIIRNEKSRRVYVTAYLVVVVAAFASAMAGTVWAVFVFYKRYTFTTPGTQKKMADGSIISPDQPMLQRMHY